MSKKMVRYSPEVRERGVRLVLEHQHEHGSQWAAIQSIAPKLGCTAETPRKWVRRADLRGSADRAAMTHRTSAGGLAPVQAAAPVAVLGSAAGQ